MRGTQDPVPKGYVGSNPTPRTKIAQNTFIISICAMEFYFFLWKWWNNNRGSIDWVSKVI